MRDSAAADGPAQSDRNWYYERQGALSFPPARSKRGTKGPRSLLAMSLRVLADNIGAVDADEITALPESLQWSLWKELMPRNISLHAWAPLSCALQGEAFRKAHDQVAAKQQCNATVPMGLYRYHQQISNPTCELGAYTSRLRGLDTGCLAYLCIDNLPRFGAQDLLHLAELPLLAVLELIEREPMAGPGTISDRLIRGWSEVGPEPFPGLRVLKISAEADAVSESALRYVRRFRRLEIFDVVGCLASSFRNAGSIAAEYGWKTTVPRGSCFVSYADAYLDGRVAVQRVGVDGLKPVFDDEGFQVSLSCEIRVEEGSSRPLRLSPGWRAISRGDDRYFSATADVRESAGVHGKELAPPRPTVGGIYSDRSKRERLTDNDAFWFLALLAHKEREVGSASIQGQVEGITLQRERFVSLRLRGTSDIPGQEQGRQVPVWHQVVFSRNSKPTTSSDKPHSSGSESPVRPWPWHEDERGETNLKPRKRQKLEDMLSSFGM